MAADREIWSAAELRRLLAREAGLSIGKSAMSDLMTKQPAEVKIKTLAALCTVLKCTPNDLFEFIEDDEVNDEAQETPGP